MIKRREVNDANAIVAGKSLGFIQIYKWLLTLPTKTCKTVNVSFSHWELGEENDSEHVLKSVNMMILLPIYICLNTRLLTWKDKQILLRVVVILSFYHYRGVLVSWLQICLFSL